MKKTIFLTLTLTASLAFSQKNAELRKQGEEIRELKQSVQNQKSNIDNLTAKVKKQEKKIDSLSALTLSEKENNKKLQEELNSKIQNTETSAKDGISRLDKDVSTNRLSWILATLGTLLLGGLIYWLLGKRISTSKTDVETQIKNTKKSLEEESVKLDSKLVEVLESQLKLKQEQVTKIPQETAKEVDHSLALKVADEIVRMQKNISNMDENTKGLKPLVKGIERIQDNFASNGYEMINLLNKDYDERMNIDVINFNEDESIEKGRKIIVRIIKPQVNYNGVLIQRAQVDVSHN